MRVTFYTNILNTGDDQCLDSRWNRGLNSMSLTYNCIFDRTSLIYVSLLPPFFLMSRLISFRNDYTLFEIKLDRSAYMCVRLCVRACVYVNSRIYYSANVLNNSLLAYFRSRERFFEIISIASRKVNLGWLVDSWKIIVVLHANCYIMCCDATGEDSQDIRSKVNQAHL